jgi:hypothetical protein
LSKAKIAYENDAIKVERLPVFSRPLVVPVLRSIMPVVARQPLEAVDEKMQDLEYWLRRPPKERLSAVTFIISQTLEKGQRMDRTFVSVKPQNLSDIREIQKKLSEKTFKKRKPQ